MPCRDRESALAGASVRPRSCPSIPGCSYHYQPSISRSSKGRPRNRRAKGVTLTYPHVPMWLSRLHHIIHFDSERGLNVAALDENRAYLSTGAAMNSLNSSNLPADIRPIAAEEVAEFDRCLGVAFGRIDPAPTWAALFDPQRCLAAFDGGSMVGGAAAV